MQETSCLYVRQGSAAITTPWKEKLYKTRHFPQASGTFDPRLAIPTPNIIRLTKRMTHPLYNRIHWVAAAFRTRGHFIVSGLCPMPITKLQRRILLYSNKCPRPIVINIDARSHTHSFIDMFPCLVIWTCIPKMKISLAVC